MRQYRKSYFHRVIAGLTLLTALLFCVPLRAVLAQDDKSDDWDSWKDFKFTYRRSPTLSIYYGWTTPSFDGFTQDFAKSGFLQFKIGGSTVRTKDMIANLVNYKYEYFEVANFAPRLTTLPSSNEVVTETWRFGGAAETGMGYGNPSSFSVILYNSGGINWSQISVPKQVLTPADSNILELYNGTFRFGTLSEGGVKLRLSNLFIIDGGYERAMIFPRTLFMKWVGSALLERVFQWGVDEFVDKVVDNSPAAAPVVSFVLKNGVSYAMYELRKKSMNWPFPSDPAMLNDTWKIGVSMTF
jgi:hypothetical protein